MPACARRDRPTPVGTFVFLAVCAFPPTSLALRVFRALPRCRSSLPLSARLSSSSFLLRARVIARFVCLIRSVFSRMLGPIKQVSIGPRYAREQPHGKCRRGWARNKIHHATWLFPDRLQWRSYQVPEKAVALQTALSGRSLQPGTQRPRSAPRRLAADAAVGVCAPPLWPAALSAVATPVGPSLYLWTCGRHTASGGRATPPRQILAPPAIGNSRTYSRLPAGRGHLLWRFIRAREHPSPRVASPHRRPHGVKFTLPPSAELVPTPLRIPWRTQSPLPPGRPLSHPPGRPCSSHFSPPNPWQPRPVVSFPPRPRHAPPSLNPSQVLVPDGTNARVMACGPGGGGRPPPSRARRTEPAPRVGRGIGRARPPHPPAGPPGPRRR